MYFFSMLFAPKEDGENDGDSDTDKSAKASTSDDKDDTTKPADKTTKPEKSEHDKAVSKGMSIYERNLIKQYEEDGIEVVYNGSKPDFVATARASKKAEEKEDKRDEERDRAVKVREAKLEKERDELYIDNQINKAVPENEFIDIEDTKAAFFRAYEVKRNRKTGKVEIQDKKTGEAVTDDEGSYSSLADVFEEWVKGKPNHLKPESKLRKRNPVKIGKGETGTGGATDMNSLIRGRINGG